MITLIKFLTIFLLCFFPYHASSLLKEQDRALLEGSRRNMLPNPGFEGRKSGWFPTGSSTFTLETAAPAYGNITGKWDASATGEFFRSELITIPEGLKNRPCSLSFEYKWNGILTDLKANVDDGTSNVATSDIVVSATDYKTHVLDFTCPGTGGLRLELESTANAAEISVDSIQLGQFINPDIINALVNKINAAPNGSTRAVSVFITNAGTPTVTDEPGDWISSIDDDGVGLMTINVDTNVFDSGENDVSCTCITRSNGFICSGSSTGSSATIAIATTTNAGAASDRDLHMICHGTKGSL